MLTMSSYLKGVLHFKIVIDAYVSVHVSCAFCCRKFSLHS